MRMRFSIIVVCLNAGYELPATVNSILSQTYTDYEIIIKDGGSTDGSIQMVPASDKIRIYEEKDHGIYDAMNQALECANGEYVYFLNCGDYLYDKDVLSNISQFIDKTQSESNQYSPKGPWVFYGDIYNRIAKSKDMSNPVIDEFACYKNVPCHQACIYERNMINMHPFLTQYKVRADYEQFLWCYFIAKANLVYMNMIVSSYMGGGYSETKQGRAISKKEQADIVENYMPHSHVVKYRWRMRLSMAPLRNILAHNPITGGLYGKIKSKIYSKR